MDIDFFCITTSTYLGDVLEAAALYNESITVAISISGKHTLAT